MLKDPCKSGRIGNADRIYNHSRTRLRYRASGEDVCDALIADRGYDSDSFREVLISKEMTPVIPGRKNRLIPIDYDKHTYKERNAVERFFARVKEYRRIATRYDKTAVMFKAGLTLVSILLWLKL